MFKKFSAFMEPKDLLTPSEELAIGPWPELDEPNLHLYIIFPCDLTKSSAKQKLLCI
jgi:hypothetical protein